MAAVTIELLADRPELITALARLRWQEWGTEPGREDLRWWADTALREAGRDAPPIAFVAVHVSGEAVGGVGLAPFDPPERTDRGPWVVGTIVHAEHRGEGIGQAMMAHLHRWAAEARIDRLWVATGGTAVDFYRSCGWTLAEVVRRAGGEAVTILTTTTGCTPSRWDASA